MEEYNRIMEKRGLITISNADHMLPYCEGPLVDSIEDIEFKTARIKTVCVESDKNIERPTASESVFQEISKKLGISYATLRLKVGDDEFLNGKYFFKNTGNAEKEIIKALGNVKRAYETVKNMNESIDTSIKSI